MEGDLVMGTCTGVFLEGEGQFRTLISWLLVLWQIGHARLIGLQSQLPGMYHE